MLFNSLAYAKFFATVFIASWLLANRPRARFVLLVCASYVFYCGIDLFAPFSGQPLSAPYLKFAPIVFIGSTVDYWLGRWMASHDDPKARKRALVVTIVMNVGLLVVFKYWNWLTADLGALLRSGGLPFPDVTLKLELPLGISFFTFMSLSYVIDVYRRKIEPSKNYLHYLTYIAFFPHLVAGPIVRGKDLLPLFEKAPRLTSRTAGEALFLIGTGIGKKVIIGDFLALNLVDRVHAEPTSYSSLEVLCAMYAYAVQVYCDFSGYSDVAIGSALLLGYRFKINFDQPFKSTNIVEFWRRWHISLSSWLRDYVYFPLGGSQKGNFRKYLNVWITMVVCGIWHGAAWTYVIFGVIQGFAVAGTHWFRDATGRSARNDAEELPPWHPGRWIGTFLTFTFAAVTFALFRAESSQKALLLYKQLLQGTTFHPNLPRSVVLILFGAIFVQWLPRKWTDKVRDGFIAAPAPAQAVVLFCVALALREAAVTEAVPFVYFQF